MKIGAAIAIMLLLAAMLLSGCPKSSTLLDNSKKPGNVQPDHMEGQGGELTQGTPSAKGNPPPAAPAAPAGGTKSGGDTGGGDSGGDEGGG